MKPILWVGLGILITIALVVAVLAGGWLLWGRSMWGMHGRTWGPDSGMMGWDAGDFVCNNPGTRGWRSPSMPGMMGQRWQGTTCSWESTTTVGPADGEPLTLEGAEEAAVDYLADLGYDDLEIAEVMEFEYNFYAIARESESGINAMELLIDKNTGAVGPEMGPNMMWNAKYGMHRGGMRGGRVTISNTITEEEALEIAQQWLDENRPGVTADDVAPFYGYYTLHTEEDGEIQGMLSVHGSTGQVWYHTWHGNFVQMTEHDDEH